MSRKMKAKLNEIAQEKFEQQLIKLNYRCPKGEFVPDSFACGKTPEEAKKNYESLHKEKSGSAKDVSTSDKKTSKVLNVPDVKKSISNVKGLIAKITTEKKAGKVSKETYRALKTARDKFKKVKSGSVVTTTPSAAVTKVKSAVEKVKAEKAAGKVSKEAISALKSVVNESKGLNTGSVITGTEQPLETPVDSKQPDLVTKRNAEDDGLFNTHQIDKDAIEGGKQFASRVKKSKEEKVVVTLGRGANAQVVEDLVTLEYDNGVKISVPKGSEDKAHQTMYKLSKLPAHLTKKVPELIVYSRRSPDDEELTKTYGRECKSRATHIAPFLGLGKSKITFWNGSNIDTNTLSHELAHEVDSGFKKSSSKEYRNAAAADEKDATEGAKKYNGYVSAYASSSADVAGGGTKEELVEDFAEMAALITTDPESARSNFRHRFEYFAGLK